MSPHPGTPLPAGGCTTGREEAPRSSRTPNGGSLISGPPGPPQPLSATAVGPGRARSPPSAPPSPRGVSPWGRPLGSLPPRSFLKFQIHLSQEEGKLLPLKPLALSSKSSLLGQRRLRAPAGPGRGGDSWGVQPECVPSALICGWEGVGTPKHAQREAGVPLKPPS